MRSRIGNYYSCGTWVRVLDAETNGLVQASKGVSSVCITEDGRVGSRLVGIVTARDTDFVNDRLTQLGELMTRWVLTAHLRARIWPLKDGL